MEKIVSSSQIETNYQLTIDLDSQTIIENNSNNKISFEIDAFMKNCLLNGLDDIGITLQREDAITAYEEKRDA